MREGKILKRIHDHASRLMDTDNMYIALYDEATDTVRFGLAFVDGERIDTETDERWQPRSGGKGRTEEIIRTKKPIFTATKAEAEAWYAQPEHKDYLEGVKFPSTFASWLGVPMMVGERVLGVIATYHPTQDHVYSGDDLAMLQAMANQAAVAIDNARMRQAEEQEAAEQKWAVLGRVSAGVAHRVGNKAGVVRVKVKELYNMVPQDEATIGNLETIERNNQYLLDLAELLLKPVKAAKEALEPLDINIVLRDARKKADLPSGIKVKMDLAKDLPAVCANNWFVEVFVELLTNAVRAMEKSPKKMLEICSRPATDNWVEVLVKDTGCGIPLALRDKIFELFFVSVQRDEEEPISEKRQGFGLWWVKTFLTDIGAQLELFESEINKGTTFMVRLPPVVGQ